MQTPEYTFTTFGFIILTKMYPETQKGLQLVLAERFHKIASLVSMDYRIDHNYIFYLCSGKLHTHSFDITFEPYINNDTIFYYYNYS
jgi:hypothetical protein